MKTEWLLYVFIASNDPRAVSLVPLLEAQPMPSAAICEATARTLKTQLNAGRAGAAPHWFVQTACTPYRRG